MFMDESLKFALFQTDHSIKNSVGKLNKYSLVQSNSAFSRNF